MANYSRIVSFNEGRAMFLLFLSMAATFFAILFGWRFIDEFLGEREVARFIADHESVVAERLRDPRVHEFSLNHDPEAPWQVLVKVDTDDKAAFDMLEASLEGIDDLRFMSRWDWKIRSGDEPHNFGHMARAAGEIHWAMLRAALAAFVAILGPFLVFLIWFVRQHVRETRRSAESSGNAEENAGKS